MANTAKLRDQARAHELRGNWREAVNAYRQILEDSEGEEVDIGLWNRIGDLHLRLNETELAVQAYEAAVNAYVDVGLYNNAIALCRKIQRLVPGRASTYLRLGQISAAKGFFADARQNFLEYADRMRKAGKLDASFAALKEFADLSPSDSDVRRLLADQLLHHGHREEAVEQLRILLVPLGEQGDEAGVAQVRQQILAIDPNASTEPLVTQARQARATDDFGHAIDTGALNDRAPASPSSAASASAPPHPDRSAGGYDVGATLEPGQDFGAVELAGDVSPIEGLETTNLDYGRGGERAPSPASSADDEDAGAGGDLPLLDFDGKAPPPAGRAADPSRFGEVSLDEEPVDFAMGDGGEDDGDGYDDGEDAEPLPLLDVDVSTQPIRRPPRGRDRLEELRERVALAPEDAHARDELVAELHERGLGHEVPEVLEEAHRELAVRGLYRDAIGPVSALIRVRPGDGILLQKRVEYAFRSGDRDALIEAYLALGRHLLAGGNRAKGEAVFQRVLELNPENPEARATLAQSAPPQRAPEPPAPAAAPAGPPADYIDLNELILGDEASRETTTRFVVEEKEPSGDEERDFAEMLAHFRQKVAENIEVEDAGSHYDLGLAFKEMGLLDEAIAEFQVALRGGSHPLATLEVLGQCFVEKGQYAVAVAGAGARAAADRGGRRRPGGGAVRAGARRGGAGAAAAGHRVLRAGDAAVDIRFRDTARRIETLRAAGPAPL
jgi:tetratricopeptide (TPR) repeat protein